jgi:ATP-dependent RNA helicase RhlE
MHQSFRELGVSSPVVDALAARSITTPFRIQALALPDALGGLDILAKAPTGSGKTLAFAVPIVERTAPSERRPSTLVLVPTRELATQVTDELKAVAKPKGLKVESAYGGVPLRAQSNRVKGAHVLVATPGRLEDLAERRLVDLRGIKILVLDEADRMLDFGFKPQVDRIVRRLPQNRQTMFFSATLDGEVGRLAREYTRSPSYVEAELATGQQPAEIEHRFVAVTTDTKVKTLAEHILASDGLTLVFVRTKRGADTLVRKLRNHHVEAVAMHGNLSQNQRERALARFGQGKVSTLVATDVAARGLDLQGVTHVINFDPPGEDKGYVHRTGRTGRAGKSGTAITFVLPDQQADTSRSARRLGYHEQFEKAGMSSAPAKLLYTSRRGRRSKW